MCRRRFDHVFGSWQVDCRRVDYCQVDCRRVDCRRVDCRRADMVFKKDNEEKEKESHASEMWLWDATSTNRDRNERWPCILTASKKDVVATPAVVGTFALEACSEIYKKTFIAELRKNFLRMAQQNCELGLSSLSENCNCRWHKVSQASCANFLLKLLDNVESTAKLKLNAKHEMMSKAIQNYFDYMSTI